MSARRELLTCQSAPSQGTVRFLPWSLRVSLKIGPLSIPTPDLSGVTKTVESAAASAEHVTRDAFNAGKAALQSLASSVLGEPYPHPNDLRARNAQIQSLVANMGLGPSQKTALADIARIGVAPADAWQGSHVVVNGDHGSLYDKWRSLPGAEARTSSHYRDVNVQQYQIHYGEGCLLFGKNANGDTWFQMEKWANAPDWTRYVTDPQASIGHQLTFLEYKALGENVGPMGRSPHTEHHDPLQIQYPG